MLRFVLRRIVQAMVTLLGVMLITFLLFNVVAGDIAAQVLGPKATEAAKQDLRQKHGFDVPLLFNPAEDLRWHEHLTETQFARHLYNSVTFQGKSLETGQSLLRIIAERAKYSLAITVPSLALGFLLGMIISSFVAYFRGTWLDHTVVFLSVLGMCLPFLAYMYYAQKLVFDIRPSAAFGLSHKANVYVPVLISVIAGLGGTVRFYRTVILNEVNQDYVRTARAKGLPLRTILFKHVLRNCMLPILTNLVMAIPFLILGSLLLEKFFGIPGLGELMISSIQNRDVPIITGLTFLTALIYTAGLLLTDILYAVFDPRIRLQ